MNPAQFVRQTHNDIRKYKCNIIHPKLAFRPFKTEWIDAIVWLSKILIPQQDLHLLLCLTHLPMKRAQFTLYPLFHQTYTLLI